MAPAEVALALKLAHAKANWDAVAVIITEIERIYGEVPLSALFSGELPHPDQECECVLCQGGEVQYEPDVSNSDTILFPWGGVVGES